MKKILIRLARRFLSKYKVSVLSVRRKLPSFVPNSAVDFDGHVLLTIQAANEVPILLGQLSGDSNRAEPKVTDVRALAQGSDALRRAETLGSLFDAYGSDKANHDYHFLYGSLFDDPQSVSQILEIGIGTTNQEVPSNMGSAGRPGASLRAFREYFPEAHIFGADVDSRILFSEERIATFAVDQTDSRSFRQIEDALPNSLDLIIDDGLHSPHANLRTMKFALTKIRLGGWAVIEDIHLNAEDLWRAAWAILPAQFDPMLIRARTSLMFAVQKIA